MPDPADVLASLEGGKRAAPLTTDEEFAIAAAWNSVVVSPEYRLTIQAEASRRLAAALIQTANPTVNGEALAMARAECAVWNEINLWAQRKPLQYQVMLEARAKARAPESPDDYVGQKLEDQWYDNPNRP